MKLPSRGISQSDSSAGTQLTDSAPELGRPRHARRRRRDAVEGGGDRRQQFGAVRRQLEPLAGALEQPAP